MSLVVVICRHLNSHHREKIIFIVFSFHAVLVRRPPAIWVRVSVERFSCTQAVVVLPTTFTGLWQVIVKRVGGVSSNTYYAEFLGRPKEQIFHVSGAGSERFELSTLQPGWDYSITVEGIEPITTGSVTDPSKYFAITRRADPIQFEAGERPITMQLIIVLTAFTLLLTRTKYYSFIFIHCVKIIILSLYEFLKCLPNFLASKFTAMRI